MGFGRSALFFGIQGDFPSQGWHMSLFGSFISGGMDRGSSVLLTGTVVLSNMDT